MRILLMSLRCHHILLDLVLRVLLWYNIHSDGLHDLLLRWHLIEMLLLLISHWLSLVIKLPRVDIIRILSHDLNRLNAKLRLLIDLAIRDYRVCTLWHH